MPNKKTLFLAYFRNFWPVINFFLKIELSDILGITILHLCQIFVLSVWIMKFFEEIFNKTWYFTKNIPKEIENFFTFLKKFLLKILIAISRLSLKYDYPKYFRKRSYLLLKDQKLKHWRYWILFYLILFL